MTVLRQFMVQVVVVVVVYIKSDLSFPKAKRVKHKKIAHVFNLMNFTHFDKNKTYICEIQLIVHNPLTHFH